ncbi:Detected protein of confused Function [Hibiscus syriacus]|uniref:Detected protein of confused Function n=1 Tax=Hibiscus syriacus TaxID=106335 RepID=A0A6A3C1D5_HIBSY|nr:Detected protein of confused Function [Hibiscus syriacus]
MVSPFAHLQGVDRAFPCVSSDEADDIVDIETPILFQLVHSKNFNVGVQALMLLDKISSKNQVVSDPFYRALYSKLLLPDAMYSSKASEAEFVPCTEFGHVYKLFLILPESFFSVQEYDAPNESVDEDLEHFEDIIEETVTEPGLASRKKKLKLISMTVKLPSLIVILQKMKIPKNLRLQEPKTMSDQNASKPPKSTNKSFLTGGYDPRHREPSYCNADRASWWELMVLSMHVHPSVGTTASTLLSGVNIVYNGNPLNDLSFTAFLDKFMEKKPKASSWHGGSQLSLLKRLVLSSHSKSFLLYGFSPSCQAKTKEKKKKAAEEEAAEGLFDVGGNEMDDDYVDGDGDYDYDDLDHVADDDLIGNASDAEMDLPLDDADGEDFDADASSDKIDDDGDDLIALGDSDDLSDDEDDEQYSDILSASEVQLKPVKGFDSGRKDYGGLGMSLGDNRRMVRKVESITGDSVRRRGRPRRKYVDCLRSDLKDLAITEDMTSDRKLWT